MILHQAICDQCGNVTEISDGAQCFQVVLKSFSLSDHNWNDRFGNSWAGQPKKPSVIDQVDWCNSTFCDRECFVNFLNEKMLYNGMIKLNKEEMENLRGDRPEETKKVTARDINEYCENPKSSR